MSEAAKSYRQAADNVWPADENAAAQLNLGHCYWNGKGVPQNYAEAVKWFRKAAEQGLPTHKSASVFATTSAKAYGGGQGGGGELVSQGRRARGHPMPSTALGKMLPGTAKGSTAGFCGGV